MSYAEEYKRKLTTPEEAVKVVKSGDWIDYGFGHTKPVALDKALAARKNELKDINIRHCLSLTPNACVESDPEGEVFTYQDWHFTGYARKLHDRGRCYYHPMIFRNQPLFYRKSIKSLDVAMLRVTKMDKDGFFNTHMGNAAVRATMDVAQKIILEVNPLLPWAMGGRDEVVHISEVDVHRRVRVQGGSDSPRRPDGYRQEDRRLHRPHDPQRRLHPAGHRRSAQFRRQPACHSDLKDLGCHTEMLVDAYYHMYDSRQADQQEEGRGQEQERLRLRRRQPVPL